MTDTPRRPLVVMGVSGCGKSSVGSALAERLGMPFVDADDLHPAANKRKMASGLPLDDDDREPWLRAVAAVIAQGRADDAPPVVACSSLKRSYRDLLREGAPDTAFVHLDGTRELLEARIGPRVHEYMPATLLDSQLRALERLQPDESGVVVDIAPPVAAIVDAVVEWLDAQGGR